MIQQTTRIFYAVNLYILIERSEKKKQKRNEKELATFSDALMRITIKFGSGHWNDYL